jgi:hypothetical protein
MCSSNAGAWPIWGTLARAMSRISSSASSTGPAPENIFAAT